MKYFVYISDTKVAMLLPQVPHDVKKKVAMEFGIDLKLLTAKRKIEEESDENRISRLEAVVTFIEQYGRVGNPDEPDEYVKGIMPMRWGPYGWGEPSLVYFGGETARAIIGLGGSLSHVIGNAGTSRPESASATPYLIRYLGERLAEGAPEPKVNEVRDPEDSSNFGLMGVHLATTGMRGPVQRLDFLAKRLLQGPSPYPDRDERPGMQVLLATPLYVALAE